MNYPSGIAVHLLQDRYLLLINCNNHIQIINNDLTFSHVITRGIFRSFKFPCDVSLDSEGHLYVAEFENHCVTKLTTAGQYITKLCSSGSAPGQLYCPSSLTVKDNLVYVCEWDNHHVSIFDTEGTFLHCFGTKGSDEGEIHFPGGITIDTFGNLYVCDTGNKRIVVF